MDENNISLGFIVGGMFFFAVFIFLPEDFILPGGGFKYLTAFIGSFLVNGLVSEWLASLRRTKQSPTELPTMEEVPLIERNLPK